jgi:hypothetical protein
MDGTPFKPLKTTWKGVQDRLTVRYAMAGNEG